ncbi:MAG: hypothetical protein WBG46_03900 [Nonlabens sp.]
MRLKLLLSILIIFFSDQKDKQNLATVNEVNCIEKEEPNPNNFNPILIKICTFKKYRSVKIGTPDSKGRYSYQYELYRIEKNIKQKINNSDIFNSGKDIIGKKINQDIKKEFEKNSVNPHLKDCMEWIDFRYYDLNEMGMAFSENNELEFYFDHGIGGACFNVSFTIQKYKISDFEEYLK